MISQIKNSDDEAIWLKPNSNNFRQWVATIKGPVGSYYENFFFDLLIDVPQEYPMVPPKITFKTKIFHPNVLFKSGEICLDILKNDAWSPAWSLYSACRALIALLADPAADSPLNCDAGNMIRGCDFRAYRSICRCYCLDNCPTEPLSTLS